MILISSAAFVNPEFRAEFGLLPPSMLPIGNKRLLEHQIEALAGKFRGNPISVSLPASYALAPNEQRIFLQTGTKLLTVPDDLTLRDSVAFCLDATPSDAHNFRILYGDTLLTDFPDAKDCVALAMAQDNYAWEYEGSSDDARVWCGFFSFSDRSLLRKCLTENEDFIGAVRRYGSFKKLEMITVDQWMDFGHINTYFKSRSKFTTQRSFNSLFIQNGTVTKTGEPRQKIVAESQWFDQIPRRLRTYAPQLIDRGNYPDGPFYVLEYLPLPPLNEVFVHGQNDAPYWRNIIQRCVHFLAECAQEPLTAAQTAAIGKDFYDLVHKKTYERLGQYLASQDTLSLTSRITVNGMQAPALEEIAQDCITRVTQLPAVPGVMHGDFCFSNILFDSRTGNIKVLDPRGINSAGEQTIYGDLRYDLAKLTHSMLGLYDHIVAGAYDCTCAGDASNPEFSLIIYGENKISRLQNEFLNIEFFPGVTAQSIVPLVVLLFLSMLPLHADKKERQLAFLANAVRIYTSFITDSGFAK